MAEPKAIPEFPEFINEDTIVDSPDPDSWVIYLNGQFGPDFVFKGRVKIDRYADGDEDHEPEWAQGYKFTYSPDNIELLVSVTDWDYDVGILQDGEIYEYIEYVRSESHIAETAHELIQSFKSDVANSLTNSI